jgi:iturin family lipopeptide synthetase A
MDGRRIYCGAFLLFNKCFASKMKQYTGLEIAVIGMSGRFPGAGNINSFWNNLKNGVESVSFFSDEELLGEGEDVQKINDPSYVKANAFLEGKENFDSEFFNYRPDEARLMDPQMRIFHEAVWEALEDAGCDLNDAKMKAGLFAGSSSNINWEVYARLINREGLVDDFSALQLSNTRFLSTRISYYLNLRGPSVYLDTACSTSLVAVSQACKSLLLGDCNVAIAGGITITDRSKKGYLYVNDMIYSRDGHCRTFDAEASGTIASEGVGVVVLKTLKNALADGDHIWAIIKGSGINNDGNNKVGYTAPSIDGQAEAIQTAHKWAKVPAESITYVETHGTATKLGDPIEVEALNHAFGKTDKPYCALGAVKSNIGHADAAAGVAGFIKTVLALKHRQLPPSLHFTTPNPAINFKESPFYVNNTLKEWHNDKYPLRAGVSSFGIGGTNVHVVLEEAPELEATSESNAHQLLVISGKTPVALQRNTEKLIEYLKENTEEKLADIAYTLQTGRTPFACRRSVVCRNAQEAVSLLSAARPPVTTGKTLPQVVFMFSGQGSQYRGMCYDLYSHEEVFRNEVDKCFSIVKTLSGKDMRAVVFAEKENGVSVDDTMYTQPLLFIMEYALAQLLISRGIKPGIMIGHSIGEYAAACISGLFSLEDALRLVIKRGELMQSAERGKMLSVSITEKELLPELTAHAGVSLAAVNSTELCVVSGTEENVTRFKDVLEQQGRSCKWVRTSHAFHSGMMDGILNAFEREVESVTMNQPQIPFISNVTGKEATAKEVMQPRYWVNHLRGTVKFSQGIETLLQQKNVLFVEVGPGKSLCSMVRANKKREKGVPVINIVKQVNEEGNDLQYFINGIGELWANGIAPDWSSFYTNQKRRKVSLPTYSFEPLKYPVLVDAFKMIAAIAPDKQVDAKDISNWFYIPSWKKLPLIAGDAVSKRNLLFMDDCGIAEALAAKFTEAGEEVIRVGEGEDIKEFFTKLSEGQLLPNRIIHASSVSASAHSSALFSLFNTAKALSHIHDIDEMEVILLTNDLYIISGNEQVDADKSVALGLLKVVSQEYPRIATSHIDISLTETNIDKLFQEIRHKQQGQTVCLRRSQRWVQVYETLKNIPIRQNFRHRGVYIITGGLGSLGFLLSKYLLSAFDAKVVLLGRGNASSKADDIHQLKKESVSGDVLYLSADVSDKEAVLNAIEETEKTFGSINGVIHAAGIVGGPSINQLSRLEESDFADQFASKVAGLKILKEVLQDKPIDFCLAISSLSSILGGLGFAAYASANTFMDHYIASHRERGELSNWTSVNLDAFDELVDQLPAVIETVLSVKNISQVIVSETELQQRLNDWIYSKTAFSSTHEEMPEVEAGGSVEETMILLWTDFFGIPGIAASDDFFDIGGDSLKAMTMLARIRKVFDVQLSMNLFFEMSTIGELSEYIRSVKPGTAAASIPEAEIKPYYRLSSAQKRLYFLYQLEEASLAYNLPIAVILQGNIDKGRIEETFNKLVARHESLRTSFETIDGTPVQKIARQAALQVEYYHTGEEDLNILVEKFIRPFDLSNAPLLRAGLITIGVQEHLLIADMHHIITDGTANTVLIREFISLYNNEQLPAMKIQYKDFAEWQQSEQQQQQATKQKDFWLNQFAEETSILDLPADFARPLIKTYQGDVVSFELGEAEITKLRSIAEAEGATMFMVILCVYNVLLSKLCNVEDVVVGTPVSGRNHADLENVIGVFVNTLPMRNYPKGELSFTGFLADVKSRVLSCLDHQEYPYEELIDELKVQRDTGRNPLFDVMFNYGNVKGVELEIPGLTMQPFKNAHVTAQFDLTLFVVESGDKLLFDLRYATDLFRNETVERFISYFKKIVSVLVQNPSIQLGAIEIITEAEKQQVVNYFNDTAVEYPKKTIVSIFEEMAGIKKHAPAVISEGQVLTYVALNEKSNQLARTIVAGGAERESIVGIMLTRSHDMFVALMAVLKAGCAYTPIDPEYPIDRIRYMAANSAMRLIITEPALKETCSQLGDEIKLIDVRSDASYTGSKDNLLLDISPNNLAYVIYTSGSTGNPKGVMIEHRNVVNFVYAENDNIHFNRYQSILCLTTISFDIFVLETILPLLQGLKIVLANAADQKDPVALGELISGQQVDLVQITPTHLRLLLTGSDDKNVLKNVKVLMVGGEAFPMDLLKEVRKMYGGDIFNMYGPTETTVWSTIQDVTNATFINIGKPIANTTIRILNKHKNLQPAGIAGELCIGGEGVARGYWKNEALTNERFIKDPVDANGRIYCTGDLVKWLPDGNIAFLGRIDHQVKLRGFRIELAEIENTLSSFEGIQQTVVMQKEKDGDKFLVAYYVSFNEVEASVLREHLLRKLPEYMIPSYFVHLEAWPLTPNGKINRRELPDPVRPATHEYVAPKNEYEQEILNMWQQVLKMDNIGTNADFFLIGGNSFKLIQLFKLIDERYPRTVKVMNLFQNRTITSLADHIKEKTEPSPKSEIKRTTILEF